MRSCFAFLFASSDGVHDSAGAVGFLLAPKAPYLWDSAHPLPQNSSFCGIWGRGPEVRGEAVRCYSYHSVVVTILLVLQLLLLLLRCYYYILLLCHLLSQGRVAVQTWGSQPGTADRIPGSRPCPHFRARLGFWDDFRAAFPRPHWLSQRHNYDHIPQAAGAALCLLVVKDLLSIHQPPLFFFFFFLPITFFKKNEVPAGILHFYN